MPFRTRKLRGETKNMWWTHKVFLRLEIGLARNPYMSNEQTSTGRRNTFTSRSIDWKMMPTHVIFLSEFILIVFFLLWFGLQWIKHTNDKYVYFFNCLSKAFSVKTKSKKGELKLAYVSLRNCHSFCLCSNLFSL